MVLIYCFHDLGVDAVLRIEPSHGALFVKNHVATFHIFPLNMLCVKLEFCSVYEYVCFSFASQYFPFFLHIYLLLWFSLFLYLHDNNQKKSANIYLKR